jgi:hypothetical protein
MRKAVLSGSILLLLLLQGGCGPRVGDVFGRASNEPIREKRGSELSSPSEVPPQERHETEKKEAFIRLREHKRLAELLSNAYQAKSQYALGGSCPSLRALGIKGLCDEVSSPFPDVSPEIVADSLTSSDEGFGRRAAEDAAKWRAEAQADKEEMYAMCQKPNGRCDTSEAFTYWQKDENGRVVNEDVEMLRLASLVTEEGLTAYILGSVSSGDLFSPAANGGDPKKGYEVLKRIRELPNLPAAPKGYYEGDSLSLSDQAALRKRLLTEEGMKDLEAIQ